jgi:hypothetical protein
MHLVAEWQVRVFVALGSVAEAKPRTGGFVKERGTLRLLAEVDVAIDTGANA